MKKAMKFVSLVFSLCLCLCLLSGCGASVESVAEDMLKTANEDNSFDLICDYKCIGAVNDTAVSFSGSDWRQQSETSGNIYNDVMNTVRVGDAKLTERTVLYLSDGQYYFEKRETFVTSEPIVTMAPAPGRNFWPAFIAAEKINEDKDALRATVILTGEELRETMKEYCGNLYDQVAPFVDWNAVSGEILVDMSEGGYVEEMKISCPEIGKSLIQLVDSSAEAKCTDFDIIIYYADVDKDILEPDEKAVAKEGTLNEYGIASTIKTLMGENEEIQEVNDEREAAQNFVPETIEEGSVTFSCNGVNVSFEFPSDIEFYIDLNHRELNLALMSHSVMEGGISGRTIVELVRGTPDDYLGGLRIGTHTTKKVEINGISGRLITEKSSETNYFGQKVYEENYFFAADVGGAVLGIRFESSYNENNTGIVSEDIISKLLNNITIG